MTRETKIGLVLGLGFIVVFGILLSNRGAREHLPPPSNNVDSSVIPPEIVLAGDLDPPPQPGSADEAPESSADVEIATVDDPNATDDIELPVIGPGLGAPQPFAGEPIGEPVAVLEPTTEATAPNPRANPAPDLGSQPAPGR